MAHATDYQSIKDISKLRKSNQKENNQDVLPFQTHGDILVYNFIRQNSNWSIDSLVNYCLQYYAEFGVDRALLSKQLTQYITERS